MVGITVVWMKFNPFQSILVHWFLKLFVHSCHLMFDQFQITFIPCSYAILFTASDFIFSNRHIHNWVCFLFGSVSLFFLELFLQCSSVAYWAPTDLGSSSFSVISFCLFILFLGFSRQESWSGLSFPSPVDHILLELSTTTCPIKMAHKLKWHLYYS